MQPFHIGNASLDSATTRGWFVGRFLQPADNLRHREDFEVKWGVHPAGQREEKGWVANRRAATISILISGRFIIRLRVAGQETEAVLSRPGDYVMWAPGTAHTWEAPTDAVVLTVRAPSLPQDQVVQE